MLALFSLLLELFSPHQPTNQRYCHYHPRRILPRHPPWHVNPPLGDVGRASTGTSKLPRHGIHFRQRRGVEGNRQSGGFAFAQVERGSLKRPRTHAWSVSNTCESAKTTSLTVFFSDRRFLLNLKTQHKPCEEANEFRQGFSPPSQPLPLDRGQNYVSFLTAQVPESRPLFFF